jgi:hypothetical protein
MKSAYLLLVTHRCDGAILSDKCGERLSAVYTQAVRGYIELLTERIENRGAEEEERQSERSLQIRWQI